MLGLTDEHIARHGKRLHKPDISVGHRAYDTGYVVRRRPDVIAFTGGGFSSAPNCGVLPDFAGRYLGRVFQFSDGNETGSYVNLLLRSDEADRLTDELLRQPGVSLGSCG